ncbi:GNAT family N-acetyltransferase [Saccharibacillus sp. JS10]|uniref:GNAT family N-acetyltransferase n=1 Tax=Saccharibacillus sp. JS10 TaxID=2950552 RepID=UPI00210F22D1|nr:GNAT family protein [Saccharibacillus sp. JS10]MCQ4087503.1 GNAT family N-acetyltransferase [Saccharibacillus sp. JS10]
MPFEIETERLILRDAVPGDWSSIHIYASNPDVVQHSIWGPNTEAETQEYVTQLIELSHEKPRRSYELVVTLKETGELIGGCGIHQAGYNAELGYTFNPQYWGKGYATEAAFAIVQLGFEQWEIHRIFATCRPGNTASSSVMKRIGMKREGRLREHLYFKGAFHDSEMYSILRQEFESVVR